MKALLFPGQGCQYIGMCKRELEEHPLVAEVFEEASDALELDMRALIFESDMPTLTLSENAQPAVVTASYALYRVLKQETGFVPDSAAGHSLGEISALIAAGALSFADGVRFARRRGALMHRAAEEKKGRAGLVLDLEVEKSEALVKQVCSEDYVTISGYNSPRQFIVAGHQSALLALEELVDEAGGEFFPFRMMPMKSDAPYHSKLMQFIRPEIEEALVELKFGKPQFEIWSTVSGQPIESAEAIPGLLAAQLVTPVYWNQVLAGMQEAGVDCFVDIGPQQIIRNLVRENTELPLALAFDDEADRESVIKKTVNQEAVV